MSTGYKVNRAADNAANHAIIEEMSTQLSTLDVAEDNAATGLDLVTTANDTLDLINERFTRLRNLAIQAENKTYGEETLKAINLECEALVSEIKNLYTQAEFNGIKIYGDESFETIVNGTTSPVATYSANPAPQNATTYATADTTLQELGIDYSSFQIYNSEGGLIESYDTLKTDTLQDIFDVLTTYGFTSSITDGVISIQSSNGRYVGGDLMTSLGITLDGSEYIDSTTQSSSSNLYYTVTQLANETSSLSDLGVLTSGTDTVTIKNKYGDTIKSITVTSSTTLGGLFNSLGNYDIQGSIDDGVITLSSSNGNYLASQGVIASLGIGLIEGSEGVTTGISQTSGGVVTYETITATGGEVTTTQEERTVTIWTTTTTSQTVTENQTETLYVTTTHTADLSTTFAQLGFDADTIGYVRLNSTNKKKGTITISSTDTIGTLITTLAENTINATLTDGILTLSSDKNYLFSGELAEKLGIGIYATETIITGGSISYSTELSSTLVSQTLEISTTDFTTIVATQSGNYLNPSEADIVITDVEELRALATGVAIEGQKIVLAKNISFYDMTWLIEAEDPIILDNCEFYGNGYTIFVTNTNANMGIFSRVANSTINDLVLYAADAGASNQYVYHVEQDYSGCLIDYMINTDLNNCSLQGYFRIVSTVGQSSTESFIGGLVGYAQGDCSLNNCAIVSNYTVTAPSTVSSIIVSGSFGGILGGANYAVCLANEKVKLNNCYSQLAIDVKQTAFGKPSVGGLVGSGVNLDISNSGASIFLYAYGTSITKSSFAGIIGSGESTLLNNVSADLRYSNKDLYEMYSIAQYLNGSYNDIFYLSSLGKISQISHTATIGTYLNNDCTLSAIGISDGSLVLYDTNLGTETIIDIDSTMLLEDFAKNLATNYNVETYLYSANSIKLRTNTVGQYITVLEGNSPFTTYDESISYNTSFANTTSEITYSISELTTISTTQTKTIFETTTSSSTQTETVDVVTTAPITYTTSNISVTSDTTFSALGLTSRAYVTVMNDNTKVIITLKTADTVSDLVTKLNTSGILTELNNGILSIAPSSKSSYVSGMSETLVEALNLDADFYSTSLGVEMTDSNLFTYDAQNAVNNSTKLSDIGVTSGVLLVQKDGNDHATIAVSSSQTVENFTQELTALGFSVKCSNGSLQIKADGDMVLKDSISGSSNVMSVFSLNNISQSVKTTYVNSDSNQLATLNEFVNKIWQARGEIKLQIGNSTSEHNQIAINTGFSLKELDTFSNIGKNMVNKVDYVNLLDNIISDISIKQVELGAFENRLDSVLEEISIKYDNLVSSRSTLRDADIADVTSVYIQQQILQQASATLLSVVANQTPQLALQLL